MSEKLIEEIQKRLNAKTIHDIRQIARAVGVPRPADGKKDRIVDGIMSIATGESEPAAPSVRGAHPKSNEYDRQLVADIMRCREIILFSKSGNEAPELKVSVASGEEFNLTEFSAEGVLEREDGKWFMRTFGKRESFISDVFVNEYFIKNYNLKEGDLIAGKCKRSSPDELAGLASISTVNGETPSYESNRIEFSALTPIYPNRRLRLECSGNNTGRIIDLLAPLGAGQRAIITAPYGTDKTAVIKETVRGLQHNNPETKIILLLIDAMPEEAADFRQTAAEVFSSEISAGVQSHVRTARLALEYAKRLTESGKDAVLVLDDLTKLTRAYNSCGKQVTASLDTAALDSTKKFLASARNTAEGGSLTIISALCCGGDSVDEAIYSGLKNLGNMCIALSLNLSRLRINPPLDIESTGTYGDERLLNEDELKAAAILRGKNFEQILKLFSETQTNEQLCELLLR